MVILLYPKATLLGRGKFSELVFASASEDIKAEGDGHFGRPGDFLNAIKDFDFFKTLTNKTNGL